MEKKYLILILVALVAVVAVAFIFTNPLSGVRGRFTGPTTMQVQLYSGANFISSPYDSFTLEENACSAPFNQETLEGNIDGIYHYQNGQFSTKPTLKDIEPGLGYIVYSNSECTLKFSGSSEVSTLDIGSSGTLSPGFNHIGGTSFATNLIDYRGDCSSYPTEITGDYPGEELDIYYYNPQTGVYSKVKSIEPGKAYWTVVDSSCNLRSSLISQNCNNYYWVDNDNKNCDQKEFCGTFAYEGLRTFNTQEQCQQAVTGGTSGGVEEVNTVEGTDTQVPQAVPEDSSIDPTPVFPMP